MDNGVATLDVLTGSFLLGGTLLLPLMINQPLGWLISPGGALLHIWNSLCSNRPGLIVPASWGASDSAIWGRAGAVVDPANGQLLVATGNAPWDGKTNWGDAVLRLTSNATALIGNYTPTNTEELNSRDVDLGSTSPVVLSPGYIAQGGKDGKIRSAERQADARHLAPPRRRAADRLDALRLRALHRACRLASVERHVALRCGQRRHCRVALPQRAARPGRGGTAPAGRVPSSRAVSVGLFAPGGGLNAYVATSGKLVGTLATGTGHWNSPIVVDGRVALPEGNANSHETSGLFDIWRLG